MNRQIKFRVWFPGINLMGLVTNLKGSNDGFLFDGVVAECWPNGKQQFYEAYKNFTLMQYTGLKDKNGKEIYEGDVMKFFDKPVAVIVWDFNAWCFEWIDPIYKTVRQFPKEPIFRNINLYEVLGNIYENPELLNSA